jgi:hypothetical protein
MVDGYARFVIHNPDTPCFRKVVSMTTSMKKAPTQSKLRIVHKFDADYSQDLAERLKLVFEPWLEIVYNTHDKKGGPNEEGRGNNKSVHNTAT